VALLHGRFLADEYVPQDWSSIPAFSKLGIDTGDNIIQIEANQEMIDSVRQSIM
jgi:hypothetical protein